jgi:vitamin B12 transporter
LFLKRCSWLILLLLSSTTAFSQVNISGTVTNEKGNALPGTNIQVKGTTDGTLTDVEGSFSLEVPENAVLVFSFQGYLRQEVPLEGRQSLQVVMKEDVRMLDNIVVTATRNKRPIENVPQKIQLISKKEIDKTIATDVTDLLKKTSGVDVIQYPGLLSGVGMRGFRPQFSGINQRTLLLIDGRPAGATNLATIGLNNVERVEVLKGPASALYGAQAMGGVVNIITKKTKGDIKGEVFGGIGSFGTTEAAFSIGGNIVQDLDFDLSFKSFNQANDFRLGGDNIFRNAFGWDKADRILWTEAGKEEVEVNDARGDGEIRPFTSYNSYVGSFRLGYDFSEKWRLDIKGDRFFAKNINTPGDIEYGSSSPGLKDLDRLGGDAILTGALSSRNRFTAKLYTSEEGSTYYRLNVNDTTTIRTQYVRSENKLEWIGGQLMDRQQFGRHFLTIGLDYNRVRQKNFSFNNRGETSTVSVRRPNYYQENIGVYVQGEMNFFKDKVNATVGLRNETINYKITGTELFPSRDETSNVVNPSLGINYNMLKNLYLHSTFGTAFTTVGIFQIAGYDETLIDKNPADGKDTVDVWIGNPGLKNQESRTFDIGLRYSGKSNALMADITYFHTIFDNNIISRVIQYPAELSESGTVIRNKNSYTNAAGTTLAGIEFDFRYGLPKAGIDIFASGVYILKADEIREVYLQPKPLTLNMHNVADLTLNYGLEYNKLQWFTSRLSGRYVGRRFDTDWSYYLSNENGYGTGNYADILYPAFMTLDWVNSFQLKNYELSLLINNLTDENYYEKRGFNLMGRNYMLRFKISI